VIPKRPKMQLTQGSENQFSGFALEFQ